MGKHETGYKNSTGPATSKTAYDPMAIQRVNQAIAAGDNTCPACGRRVLPGVLH